MAAPPEIRGFEYLEDGVTSDVTFRAWGRDLDELFVAAADATTNAMVRLLDSVEPRVTKRAAVTAGALDLLLMRFLEELIFWKDSEQLLLRASDVSVRMLDDRHEATAQLRGERIDPGKHQLEADVKGITLHALSVERVDSDWQAQVTLDV